MDNNFVKCVSECCHNILKGNVPVSKTYKTKLSKFQKQLRQMADRSITLKKKHKIIAQKGGFIGPLISVIAPLLGGILGSLK